MRYLPSFVVRVECFAGVDVLDACKDMVTLADRIGAKIEAKFNGVTVWAKQGDDPQRIADAYMHELGRRGDFKLAQDQGGA
jgi:hypothetical protein